jgi:antibiotic biosynthesis monooxygenase (ABM) superfamily enzyme
VIIRIWHGYTTPENAGAYEALLKTEIFQGIENKHIQGFRGIEMFRRPLGDEPEFVTLMRFDTLDDVRTFVGEDYEQSYVPDAARKILKRFDERSQHYDLKESRRYGD